jgi:hypothetical protein
MTSLRDLPYDLSRRVHDARLNFRIHIALQPGNVNDNIRTELQYWEDIASSFRIPVPEYLEDYIRFLRLETARTGASPQYSTDSETEVETDTEVDESEMPEIIVLDPVLERVHDDRDRYGHLRHTILLDDERTLWCSICMESYVSGDVQLQLPCGHIFHQACAEQWLCQNETCPLDRRDVFEFE